MRRIATGAMSIVLAAVFAMSAAAGPAAAAATVAPVVTVGPLDVYDSGGVSPDTWRTYVTVPVGGYYFTPGGNVYVTFQDLTAGSAAINGEWIRAGTGPCGLECNNYGRISYTRTLNYPYLSICDHVVRTWAYDQGKGLWAYKDVRVSC